VQVVVRAGGGIGSQGRASGAAALGDRGKRLRLRRVADRDAAG